VACDGRRTITWWTKELVPLMAHQQDTRCGTVAGGGYGSLISAGALCRRNLMPVSPPCEHPLPSDDNPPLEGHHMPEPLQLSLPWKYFRVRPCEVCGREHEQVNSPICNSCRYQASKHPCAIPGCDRLIADYSKTCLWHRPLQGYQPRAIHTCCKECGVEMTPSPVQACLTCQKQTYALCACGCGRYRRKYDAKGAIRLFISGHNDVWINHRRPLIACVVCQTPFRPKTPRQRLCSIPCRSAWIAMNPPREKTRAGRVRHLRGADRATTVPSAAGPGCRLLPTLSVYPGGQ
jgi:hypothetical protein